MYLLRISFLTTLDIYKTYFKSRHTRTQRQKSLFFSMRSYCVFTPQDFVTKCFLIFIVYKVKNFATNNNHSSCWSQSCTRIRVKGQSHIGDFCIKGKKATTRSSPIGYLSEGLIVSWYFGIGQGSGKILHSCNRLIIDQQILGSGDLKFTGWDFFLAKGFLHLSTNHRVNLFSIAHYLLGALSMPS